MVEVKAGISEKERGLQVVCPECASEDMEQVFKAVPFVSGSTGTQGSPVPAARPSAPCGPSCGCFH